MSTLLADAIGLTGSALFIAAFVLEAAWGSIAAVGLVMAVRAKMRQKRP